MSAEVNRIVVGFEDLTLAEAGILASRLRDFLLDESINAVV